LFLLKISKLASSVLFYPASDEIKSFVERDIQGGEREMRAKIAILAALAILALGGVVATPSVSQADFLVTSIVVNFGGGAPEFCGAVTAAACAGGATKIWDLSAGGINLLTGQTLVLTQGQNGGGFNFDTSDLGFSQAVITINGTFNFTDGPVAGTNNVLNGTLAPRGTDPIDTAHQEATDYSETATQTQLGLFNLNLGYADNIHTNACADASGNCLPEVFQGTATFFLGGGATPPAGYPQGGENHCDVTTNTCFDAGVIMITALQRQIPEPSSLLLLGAGLMGLATYARKQLRKNS
jgi:hypothetical protein